MDNKELQDRLYTLEEQILNLQDINKNNTTTQDEFNSKIKEYEKQSELIKLEINKLKDIKSQIFAVMALFFGIFAFISIDLNLTKAISWVTLKENDIIITMFSLAGMQILLFVCIYYCIILPFLNKTYIDTKCTTYKVVIISLIIMSIGILYVSIKEYLDNKNLNEKINTLEKYSSIQKE